MTILPMGAFTITTSAETSSFAGGSGTKVTDFNSKNYFEIGNFASNVTFK